MSDKKALATNSDIISKTKPIHNLDISIFGEEIFLEHNSPEDLTSGKDHPFEIKIAHCSDIYIFVVLCSLRIAYPFYV